MRSFARSTRRSSSGDWGSGRSLMGLKGSLRPAMQADTKYPIHGRRPAEAPGNNPTMFLHRLLSIAVLISLAACDGSSTPPIDEANAKEAEARSLAPATPCATDNQCGKLQFIPPTGDCGCTSFLAYSLIAPSAQAASATAAQQHGIATVARSYIVPKGICGCAAPRAPVCDAAVGCKFEHFPW